MARVSEDVAGSSSCPVTWVDRCHIVAVRAGDGLVGTVSVPQ
ncbi:hypothetical protein ACIREE_26240 [Streptomyces sp. NPDC102467]